MADNLEILKEKWQGWLALSTAIMAVLAALTTLYMGKYSSRAIMNQGLESDQWAFYQAKSIKQHSFEMNRTALELQFRSQKRAAGRCGGRLQEDPGQIQRRHQALRHGKEGDQRQGRGHRQGQKQGPEYGGQFRLCPDLPADRHHALIPGQPDQTALPLVHRPALQHRLVVLLPGCLDVVLLNETPSGRASRRALSSQGPEV